MLHTVDVHALYSLKLTTYLSILIRETILRNGAKSTYNTVLLDVNVPLISAPGFELLFENSALSRLQPWFVLFFHRKETHLPIGLQYPSWSNYVGEADYSKEAHFPR